MGVGGVTGTERLLALFCERSFLKLWSYANPYKDDGHELCDLLAVFGDTVFIFFDREKRLQDAVDKDLQVIWSRWKRDVVEAQVRTAHGAARYIKSGRAVFLDAARTKPFPLPVPKTATVHKIIVAHGAADACKRASSDNVYGSLAISYSDLEIPFPEHPFFLHLDRGSPVHVFDTANLHIVLGELDTVTDFTRYLEEKVRAIMQFQMLSYCGEEDLLAHFLVSYEDTAGRHVIGKGTDDRTTGLMISEGEWQRFSRSTVFQNTKKEDRISYFWDDLINRTCENALKGVLGGNADLHRGQSAIFEMVKEPRFSRRALARRMLEAVERFPAPGNGLQRQITFLPSFENGTAYVLLQLGVPADMRGEPDFREKRQMILEIACGATKNRFPDLRKVIGIGIENPKYTEEIGEDFIFMPCESWPDEVRRHYETLNREWQFYASPKLQKHQDRVTQFVHPPRNPRTQKVGRNDPCPCGSGEKFKRCHGR